MIDLQASGDTDKSQRPRARKTSTRFLYFFFQRSAIHSLKTLSLVAPRILACTSNDSMIQLGKLTLTKIRIATYCLMPNHWHLLLWSRQDGELSKALRWITVTP